MSMSEPRARPCRRLSRGSQSLTGTPESHSQSTHAKKRLRCVKCAACPKSAGATTARQSSSPRAGTSIPRQPLSRREQQPRRVGGSPGDASMPAARPTSSGGRRDPRRGRWCVGGQSRTLSSVVIFVVVFSFWTKMVLTVFGFVLIC